MKEIIEDLFDTVERLEKELNERIAFEHKLMDIINLKDKELKELKGLDE